MSGQLAELDGGDDGDDDGGADVRAALREHLGRALRERDRVAVSALRSALAALDNAEAVPVDAASAPRASAAGSAHVAGAAVGLGAAEVPRARLTRDDVLRLLAAEVAERTEAAAQRELAGRQDLAERLRAEADVVAIHLGDRAGGDGA